MTADVRAPSAEKLAEMVERFRQREADGGGDPPDNPPMEARFTRIEDRLTGVESRLGQVDSTLEYLAKEVGQFKWWLVAAILTVVLTVFGTGVAIQQMTVATFQAAGQQATPPAPAREPMPPIIINVPAAAPAAPSPAK